MAQPAMTSSVWDWEEALKYFPKPILFQRKWSWSLYDGLLPSDPLQLSESQWKHYIWEVCSANRWDAVKTATSCSIGQQNGPNTSLRQCPKSTLHNQHFKSWTHWAMMFCLILHSHLTSCRPTTTLQASQQLFAGKTLLQPAEGRKCFPRVHRILKHGFLHYKNKQTYFSLEKCVDCNGSYFD